LKFDLILIFTFFKKKAQFKNGQYCDFNGAPYCGDCYDESSKTKKGM